MTIQQLKYIVALDTHRHFVKAADSCFVSQPTLTLQVKKLEEEIDLVIFDRSTQPLSPTPMGEKFISKARQILREIDELKAMLHEDKNLLSGTYRIGIIPTLAPYLLPLFLKDFSDTHPEIHLELKETQSEEIIRSLQNGTLDIGILATPLDESNLREIPMFYEPFLVYAHEEHNILWHDKIKASEINEKGLWLMDQGHCFRSQVLNICNRVDLLQTSDKISFESGSIETLKNMIQNYSGYTLIPELAVNMKMDKNYIRHFNDPQPAREISIVVHKSFTKELLLTRLRKSVIETVPKHFRKNSRFFTVKWR